MPAVFVGHGSPTNALERNRFTGVWRSLGERLPRPRAVLVISAHWYTNATAVTAMAQPRTIHDFFGFPDELFAVEYPAPGAPDVAAEVAEVVAPQWVGLDTDSWGLDHGTWSVLVHLFPDADVPVLQLSINALEPLEYHLDIGRRLAPLRDRGVLVLGSGNVVHDLRGIDWSRPEAGFEWAERYDDAMRSVMSERPGDVLELLGHPDHHRAVPTPDHFIPLLHVAGLADVEGTTAEVPVSGCAFGSISMTCFTVDGPPVRGDGGAAPGPPSPVEAPAEDTNL
ncbi:MAG: 4,5-DOPA dioxygenase extradiol [Acidimicrobiia bacterium]|nr:4,5-DOPA dioxygenase extradiol [Acidimicrobiia bacterium]